MLAAGYADGTVRAFHVTSHRSLLGEAVGRTGSVHGQVALAPREDLVLASTRRRRQLLGAGRAPRRRQPRGPLRPVWYEGYPGPAYVWQSSGGDRHLRTEAEPGAPDLRHPQGDLLLAALRAAPGDPGGHLHQRVSGQEEPLSGQARDRDHGQPAQRGPGFPGRAGHGAAGGTVGGRGPGRYAAEPVFCPARRPPLAAAAPVDPAARRDGSGRW